MTASLVGITSALNSQELLSGLAASSGRDDEIGEE
jgi:hypothetical protein